MTFAAVRRSAVVAAVAATVLGVSLLVAPSASATPLGAVQVSASSPTSVTDYKGVTVYCPAGKKVISAGAVIYGAEGHVVLNAVVPNPTLTSVFASGWEDDTAPNEWKYPGTWRIAVVASCAAQLSGQVRIYASSAYNSTDNKSATATCPAGRKVLGLGGDIMDGSGNVLMGGMSPSTDLTSVTVTGRENDSVLSNWSVRAYAICSYPPIGLRVVSGISTYSSISPRAVSLACPSGLGVLSAGAALPPVGPIPYEVGVTKLLLNAGYSGVLVTAEEHDPYAAYWVVAAYAICAQVF